jgi:hypothetical protein
MPAEPVDIDDVIIAWAAILPELGPATRAAVREAQPLAVNDDVITFGVPRAQYETALPRFKKEADTIRAALSERLGRSMKFKPVAHDGFAAPASSEPTSTALAAAEPAPPLDEPPDDDLEYIDITETVDVPAGDVAVDSVGLFTTSFDATVVEELPRD